MDTVTTSTNGCAAPEEGRTLAIVKPDAADRTAEIEDIIQNEGLQIVQKNTFQMTVDQASDLYAEHATRPHFQDLVDYMTSGVVTAMVLRGKDVVQKWRHLIGPTSVVEAKAMHPQSIRAKMGSAEFRNAVHGSSEACAEREITIFFPDLATQTTVTGQAAKAYLADTVNPILLTGLTELCKLKPDNPIPWLADWLLINNPKRQDMKTNTGEDTTEDKEEQEKADDVKDPVDAGE